ncbi:hypothetical protein ACFLZZ_01020 [Nanoarchaeota archaeon]
MKKGVFLLFVSLSILLVMSLIAAEENLSSNANIEMYATLNKDTYSPGDKIKIGGFAKDENQEPINGIARVMLENEYRTNVRNGNFYFETILGGGIQSGENEIFIEVEDDLGGYGNLTKKFEVRAIPSRLEVSIDKRSYLPGDVMKIAITLKDQNSEEIDADVSLTIYDSRGAEMKKIKIDEGKLNYVFPQSALPGKWWIYAFSKNEKGRKFFTVDELENADIKIVGNELKVANLGNVPYEESLLITFLGEKKTVTDAVNVNVGVGKESVFELNGPEGNYLIEVETENFNRHFKEVPLTGGTIGLTAKASLEGKVVAFGFILAAIAMFLFFKRGSKKKEEEDDQVSSV